MQDKPTITVGAAIAQYLAQCGVKAAFGVISIHNMPILDAMNDQGRIRFVPARGEAGATNMADAYARTSGGLGVCLTSTGTAAGNAAGAMVEALTAGTPLLHITGQIEVPYLDQDLGYIHEAPDQLTMLQAVSKQAFRIRTPESAMGILKRAVRAALTAPTGPVSVEVPIDVQATLIALPDDLFPPLLQPEAPDEAALDLLAQRLQHARRPMLWLGGGARQASAAARELADMGFGVVTSAQGRGTVAEDHPHSLGSYTLQTGVEDFYARCDAMLVVGSRLRSNETLKYELKLPRPLHRIDINPSAQGRCYDSEVFVCGDARLALEGLVRRLRGRLQVDSSFGAELRQARDKARAALLDGLGPYRSMIDTLQQRVGPDFNWVRDVTLSNSIWGNRELQLMHPTAGVHALGGGIGQGLAMAIGAALASAVGAGHASGRKTFCLVGDGGFILNLGEVATLVQERADAVILLMNDQGYGVIKNIQDVHYGARRCYADLHTPNYETLCTALGLAHHRVSDLAELGAALDRALAVTGPVMVEVDMLSIGSFKAKFAGPPLKPAVKRG